MTTAAATAFIGYALRWSDVRRREGYTQTVAPGAFARCLAARGDIRCVFEGQVLGALRDGSLSIVENVEGLLVELQPWQAPPALVDVAKGARLALHYRAIDARWAPPPQRRSIVAEAALLGVAIVRTRSSRSARAFLPKTSEVAWRVAEADLDARMRELRSLEAECEL